MAAKTEIVFTGSGVSPGVVLGQALKLDSQVKKFGQSAAAVGLSRQEIIEAVIQTAPYGGFPRALNALGALSDVFSGAAQVDHAASGESDPSGQGSRSHSHDATVIGRLCTISVAFDPSTFT